MDELMPYSWLEQQAKKKGKKKVWEKEKYR